MNGGLVNLDKMLLSHEHSPTSVANRFQYPSSFPNFGLTREQSELEERESVAPSHFDKEVQTDLLSLEGHSILGLTERG